MADHIREAERIQYEIARKTTSAITWTGGLSALFSALAIFLALWVAWEGKKEKKERKEKAEEEEKSRRDKADEEDTKRRKKADEEDEKRWKAAAKQLEDIRRDNVDLRRAINDAKAESAKLAKTELNSTILEKDSEIENLRILNEMLGRRLDDCLSGWARGRS